MIIRSPDQPLYRPRDFVCYVTRIPVDCARPDTTCLYIRCDDAPLTRAPDDTSASRKRDYPIRVPGDNAEMPRAPDAPIMERPNAAWHA
jgi:hypothetical protein